MKPQNGKGGGQGRRNDFLARENHITPSLVGTDKDFDFCSEKKSMVICEQHSNITLHVKRITRAALWKADTVGTRTDKVRTGGK